VHLRAGAQVDEQREQIGVRGRAPALVGEDVEDGEGAAGPQRRPGPAEQARGLLGCQVMDQVEAEHRVVAVAEVRACRVAFTEPHPVGQAGRGDDLPADGGAARKVEDGGGQPWVPAAQAG
jgi:hypothetical protein